MLGILAKVVDKVFAGRTDEFEQTFARARRFVPNAVLVIATFGCCRLVAALASASLFGKFLITNGADSLINAQTLGRWGEGIEAFHLPA